MASNQHQNLWRKRYYRYVKQMTNRCIYLNKHSKTTTRKITPEEVENYNTMLNKTDCHKLKIQKG